MTRRLFASLTLAVLLCLGLSFSPPPDSVTYYVNNLAAAGGDGTTQALTGAHCAWDTLADVNAASFAAGDSALISRGTPAPVYYEQLTPPSSGSAGLPITFGAYGTGDDPIISGAQLLTSWTQDSQITGDILDDNFDDGNTTGWTKAGGGTIAASTEQAYSGTYSVKATATWTTLYQSFTAANQVWFRAYIKPTAWPAADSEMLMLRVGGTAKIYYVLTSAGLVSVWNTVAVEGYTGTQSLTLNAWNLVEGMAKASATVGEVELKISGVSSIDVTSKNTGASDFDRFDFGLLTNVATVYFDDVGVDKTSYLGPVYFNTWYKALAADPNTVAVDGVFVAENATSIQSLASETWYWDATNTRLYFKTDGTTAITAYTIESPGTSHCAYSNAKSYLTFSGLHLKGPSIYDGIYQNHGGVGLTVTGCAFTNFYGNGIEITGGAAEHSTVTIQDCTFSDAGRLHQIYIYPHASSTSTLTIDGCTFDCTFYDGTTTTLPASSLLKAIGAINQDAVTISNSTITFPSILGDTSTILCQDCTSPIVEGISIVGGNHGITFYNAASGGIIRRNIIKGSYDDNIWIYGTSDGVQVYYNLCLDSSDDGIDSQAINTEIYNNTITRAIDTGIVIRDSATGNVVKNNILYENGAVGTPTTGDEGGHEILVDATSTTGFVANNNCYYHTGAKVTATPFSWNGTSYSFANWKTNSSQDASALNTDPLMTTPASDVFTLQAASPCINAGTDVGLTEDYAGNPIGDIIRAIVFQPIRLTVRPIRDMPDIGAYEYKDH